MRWRTHHKLFYFSWDFRRVYRKWRHGLEESRLAALRQAYSVAVIGWRLQVWSRFEDSEDVMRAEMARYTAILGWLVAAGAVVWGVMG